MKKLLALILASVCILSFAACKPVDPGYANTVVHAGCTNMEALSNGALNSALLQDEDSNHLPIFKLDTLSALESFKATYGSILSLDKGYKASSFEHALTRAQWDRESFFEDHTLLVIYIPGTSGSLKFGVKDIAIQKGTVTVSIEQTNNPIQQTMDFVDWFVIVEIEDSEIKNCTSFDAVFEAKEK